MADGQKELRYRFSVDDKSVEQVIRAISRIRVEAERMVSSLSQTGAGIVNGFNKVGGPGSGFSAGAMSQGAGRGAPGGGSGGFGSGMATALTRTLVDNKNLIKSIASDSKDAARVMREALNDSIGKQKQKVDELKKSVTGLAAEYKRLKDVQSGMDFQTGYGDAAIQKTGDRLGSTSAELMKAKDALKKLQGMDGAAGKGGFMNWLTTYQAGTGPVGKAVSGVAGAFGLSPSMLGALGPIGAVYGAARVYDGVSTAMQGVRQGNMANYLQLQMDPFERRAIYGQTFGQLGMAAHGGDIARLYAMRAVANRAEFRKYFGTNGDVARQTLLARKNGLVTGGDGDVDGDFRLSTMKSRVMSKAGAGLTGIAYGDDFGMGHDTQADINFNRGMANMDAEKAQAYTRMVEQTVASNPYLSSVFNGAYSGAVGRLGAMRAAGIGGTSNRFWRSATGNVVGLDVIDSQNQRMTRNPYIDWASGMMKAGYTEGEGAQMRQAVAAAAGRGLMGAGGAGMLSMQYGGLSNVAQLFGAGSQFGNGNAFLGTVQHGIGRGGMDVTAGSQVAGLVAAAMTSGNFMGSDGRGLMEGMLSAGSTGNTGGDMRMARMLQSGFGEYGRNLSGGTDGLQQGINMLAANSALGGRGWYAKKALMSVDPGVMLQMLRTGKVPQYLADQGVDIGGAREYNRYRNQFAFSRYIDAEGGGSATAHAVAGVKQAGSVGAYLHQLFGKSGGTAKQRERVLNQLGSARMATEGGSLEGNIGALYAEIAGDSTLTRGLKAGGAHDPVGKDDPRRKVLASMADEMINGEKTLLQNLKEFTTLVKDAPKNAVALDDITSKLVSGADNFDKALTAVGNSLMAYLWKFDPTTAGHLAIDRAKQEKALADAAKKAAAPTPQK